MYKIHHIFLIKFFTLFIGSFIFVTLLAYFSVKSIIIDENKNHLMQTISIVIPNIQHAKDVSLYLQELHKKATLRVTIVDEKGQVLFENDTDKETMGNHADREELIKARNQEFGSSVRFSETLQIDYIYVAKKIPYKNSFVYLRLAMPLNTVMDSFYQLISKMLVIFATVLLVAYLVARSLSHKVVYDTKQLKAYLEEIDGKNYEAIVHMKYIYEFLEISVILKNIIKRLHKKDKKNNKLQ